MEQNNSEEGVIDLSETLGDISLHAQTSDFENDVASTKRVPAMYGLIIKLSRGVIKSEKQAKNFLVLLIIIVNLISFYLIYKQFGGGSKESTLSEGNMAAESVMP
jgi:hypothetical protein